MLGGNERGVNASLNSLSLAHDMSG